MATEGKSGIFNRLMQFSQSLAAPGVLHIDSTSVKCHRTATGAGGAEAESVRRSRSRLTTKVHQAVDGSDLIRKQLTSLSQQADCTQVEALKAELRPLSVVGDKAREHWRERGIGVCGQPKRNRLVLYRYDAGLYRTWHVVENLFNRLNDFRRLSLRLNEINAGIRAFAAPAAAILKRRLKVRLCS